MFHQIVFAASRLFSVDCFVMFHQYLYICKSYFYSLLHHKLEYLKKKYKGFPDPRQHNNWAIETSRISNCVNTPFKYCDVIHPTRDAADVTMFKPMAGQLLGLCTGSTFAAQAIIPFASIWVIVHLCIFIKVDTISSILVWCIHSRTSNIVDLSSRSRSVQRFCNNSFVKIYNCNALAFMMCGKMWFSLRQVLCIKITCVSMEFWCTINDDVKCRVKFGSVKFPKF